MSEQKISLTMYDAVKGFLKNSPVLTKKQIKGIVEEINSFEKQNNNNFYMLLCRDINYYTIFQKTKISNLTLGHEAIECIQNIGDLVDFSPIGNNENLEFWIKQKNTSEPIVAYLFPYDLGIVGFGG